jgi:2-C-methyl-D-erythritol 4-phosphate cytidylyltransferase
LARERGASRVGTPPPNSFSDVPGPMKTAVILAGAGRGERLGTDLPKAFVHVGGRTLLDHAVAVVDACPDVDAFVVAVPAGWEDRARETAMRSAKLLAVVAGGQTRQASVGKALSSVPEGFEAILCHDVARPLASPKLFSAVVAALDRAEGAVPTLPPSDTVKRVTDGVVAETLGREALALAQTPQAFRRDALVDAHRQAGGTGATDDAALVERSGYRVVTVPGDERNLKVTGPGDLRLVEALLEADG